MSFINTLLSTKKRLLGYLTRPDYLGWSDKHQSYVTTERIGDVMWTNLWSQDQHGRWLSHTSYGRDINVTTTTP
jgi:hypothetical protein